MSAWAHDWELMVRVQSGEEDCLGPLLARHREPLILFLRRMVGNTAIAEEIAQEAFLRVYLHRNTYKPTARFSTWLYHIGSNLALNWLRDHRRELDQMRLDAPGDRRAPLQIPDLSERADDAVLRGDAQARLRAAVLDAVGELPERQRVALLLRRYEDMDYEQIAQVMDCSVPTIKSLLFRAHDNLRRRLTPVLPQL
ncbi:MAG: sigma-70 family RNA polymerase sigma factor [Bryobacteraceae bacterium]